METLKEFIEKNNLQVDVYSDDREMLCVIIGSDGTFKFSMTREKLMEHIRRFTQQEFTEAILSNEKAVKTHFRRLAVTWWYIAVISDERNMEIR